MRVKRSDIKAFAAELIREVIEREKTLYAFDLDDTLIKSSSKVIVKSPEGTKKLTPAEYAIYTPLPSDELDFSEFSQIKNPSLIKDNVKIFLDTLKQSSSISKTIILTARTPDITKDIQDLLDFKNLPQVEIHAVGSSDPQKKADVIQDFIDQGFTQIRFFDDSPANIKAVNNLRPINPDVDIRTKLVVHALEEAGKGLWHNIRAKRARGDKPSHPNSKAFKSAVKAGKEILKKEIVEPALEQDVDPKELQMGIEVEMEHTDSKKEAKVIALQHLAEDPKYYTKLKSLNLENVHEPVKPGILKKRLGKLSCTKVRQELAKLEDKGTHFAKALQRYLNYQCKD
jgi:hypothetical protein